MYTYKKSMIQYKKSMISQIVLDTILDLFMCNILFLPMKASDTMYDLAMYYILFLPIISNCCQNYM